jgi:hypothetical protein
VSIDIILECYERSPSQTQLPAFLGLIGQFNRTSVCQLLGFKFKQHQLNDGNHGTTPLPPLPFIVVIILIHIDSVHSPIIVI